MSGGVVEVPLWDWLVVELPADVWQDLTEAEQEECIMAGRAEAVRVLRLRGRL